MRTQDGQLNTCGCCEGIQALTPARIPNQPGLSALAYRAGTHAAFKATTQAAISKQPALRPLTTRENKDPAIALCDAWAMVLDVLSFYQERIANEGFLRTATERHSILEMARSIGYELRPGVAAGTYLAFSLETAQGSPSSVRIAVGTKAQSLPGQNEKPQVFETIEEIEARGEWNAIKPRMTQPQVITTIMGSVILWGTASNLKQGDKLLIVQDADSLAVRTIVNVTPDDTGKTTRIDFEKPELSPPIYDRPTPPWGSITDDFPTKVILNECAVKKITSKKWTDEDLLALARIQDWTIEELKKNISKMAPSQAHVSDGNIFAFRQKASVFGYNAAKQPNYSRRLLNPPSKWDEWDVENDESGNKIYLDSSYDTILPNSFVAICKKGALPADVYEISGVAIYPRTQYGLSAKTTVLTLKDGKEWWDPKPKGKDDFSVIRSTIVHSQSEKLAAVEVPIEETIQGNNITLDSIYLGLKTGQVVILTGERYDLAGVMTSEIRTITEVIIEAGYTVLTFNSSLDYSYVRNTVTINANVAPATHGETKKEILGNGDGSQAFKKFKLSQKPLTYVSAATPSGVKTTLELRVDGLLWEEVTSLDQQPSIKKAFITRRADDGTITVQFGDGNNGLRPTTGMENVSATYRIGTGLGGMVKAGQISLLMTRPLGVKGVINPLAPTGADDPEKLENARRNAPRTVLTLDRIVSRQDYEDFVSGFAGIGKAQAMMLWDGLQCLIHITVAGADGGTVPEDSDLYKNLIVGIDAARHPDHLVKVESYVPLTFNVKAKIQVDSSCMVGNALNAARGAVEESFSFTRRSFGQAVTAAEVLAVMQAVTGVIAVDLDALYLSSDSPDRNPRLPKNMGDWEVGVNKPAKLLTVNPQGIVLKEMTV